MLLGSEMPLIGPPPIRGKPRDAKRCQQLWELQEDVVLPSSQYIRQDLPRVGSNGVPQPAWMRLATHETPHVVQLCTQPAPSIQFLRAADVSLDLLGMQAL
jgi:hypothetical protein